MPTGTKITLDNAKEIILSRCSIFDDCLVFKGARNRQGYGTVRIEIDGKIHCHNVHRVMAHIYGIINIRKREQLALHKKECKNKSCILESHLYGGNYLDNRRDRLELGGRTNHNDRKVLCNKGHNDWGLKPNGKRYCKECHRIFNRNHGY